MTISPNWLLFTSLVTLSVTAQDGHERSDLALMQRQIIVIEQVSKRVRSGQAVAEVARYRFDSAKFAADLERVRQGINRYLFPSRAQPSDLAELAGDYRTEAPDTRSFDEHD